MQSFLIQKLILFEEKILETQINGNKYSGLFIDIFIEC